MASALANKAFLGSALVAKPAAGKAAQARAQVRVSAAAARPSWKPGTAPPKHLDGSLPGDFGFDPLNLGQNPENLRWYVEAELVHSRWAMLGAAGVLGQELVKPDIFFYDAPTKIDLPFNIIGLIAFQAYTMHFVEVLRWQDFKNPGSVNKDPIFAGNALPDHKPGYPGGVFAPFVPGDMNELKLKEIKNGRLAMLAWIGFVMAGQVTGKGPLANLADHLANPMNTHMFAKAVVFPNGQNAHLPCAIPDTATFQGITFPTPCFLEGFWP
jgi:light-harvesting complex I chlorophyll a/b binding protein 4